MPTEQQRFAGLPNELVTRLRALEHALRQQQLDTAEREAAAAIAQAPQHPEVLRLFALVESLHGRPDAAIAALRKADAARPHDPQIHTDLAGVYERANDLDLARAALQRACELGPRLPGCWFNLGRFLYGVGEIAAAVKVLRRTLELSPSHMQARALLAGALTLDGRSDEAAAQFREILAVAPTNGSAWWGLGALTPTPLGTADIARMREALKNAQLSEYDRIAIGYALAHALERQDNYAAAFAALQDANARARRLVPWDTAQFSARLDEILEVFSAPGAEAARGEEVIFIVSLPRSGSTLIEQILASHSQVEGTAELPDLPQVIAEESRRMRQPFPRWAATHTAQQWQALGERYLQRTRRWRQQRPRFTDKMPGNWLYVGAILAMLPHARVVIVRRDPLETCLACYRYLFNQHGYMHDFEDLATAWAGFDRACKQWTRLYPARVHEVVYEELVANPDAQIRNLLEFCDLPFEDNCVNFHVTQRRVATASTAQVREPLRAASERAAKYGALLDPLRAALAERNRQC